MSNASKTLSRGCIANRGNSTPEHVVVPAVLVYVRQGERVLMLHRGDRPGDHHSGKWNGLGGKLELALQESPVDAAIREVREESGLVIGAQELQARGVLHFPEFRPASKPAKGLGVHAGHDPPGAPRAPHAMEDWIVWVFVASIDRERAAKIKDGAISTEGTLHWMEQNQLLSLNLWPGDRAFIPQVLDLNGAHDSKVIATLWYQDGQVARSQFFS